MGDNKKLGESSIVQKLKGFLPRTKNQQLIIKGKEGEDTFQEIIQNTRKIINNIGVGVIIYDTNLIYHEWNPVMEKLTGFKKNNVIGKHPSDIFPFLEEKAILGQLQGILAGNNGFTSEFQFKIPSSGLIRFASDTSQAILDTEGKVVGILSMVHEITDPYKIDEILNVTQSSLLSIANSTTDIFFIKDLYGKYTFVNNALAKLFGIPINEIINKDDTELFPELEASPLSVKDFEIIKSDEVLTYEESLKLSDGNDIILHVIRGPLHDSDGKITGLFGVSRDITHIKKSEKELKRLNRTLKMITVCNKILSKCNTEPELLEQACNTIITQGGYRMCWIGYIDDENDSEIITPVARGGADYGYLPKIKISYNENNINGKGPSGRAIRERKTIVINDILKNSDFTPWKEAATKANYGSSISLPLIGDNNKIIGVLNIYSHKSEIFNVNEISLLTELSLDLSRGIQLLKARDKMKKTDELLKLSEEKLELGRRINYLGTFAGGISHDINNLLTPVFGYLDLAKAVNNSSDNSKKFINKAMNQLISLSDLVRQVQNLSSNTITEKTSIDIHQVINNSFKLLKTGDVNLKIIIDFLEDEYYVLGNNSKLQEVLLRLGTNALTAIEEKDDENEDSHENFIKIKARNFISDGINNNIPKGEYIHISIADSGKGMSEETLKNAFNPFVTTKARSSKKGQGLSLTMVYNIITKGHNGFIDIDSEEGIGTIVNIFLPKSSPPIIEKQTDFVEKLGGDETILVVDDEPLIRTVLETSLKRFGYNVITAHDGQHGFDKYLEHKDEIDLVILDLTMPRMSGQQVFEKMLEVKKDINVIISSGQASEAIRDGVLLNAKGFLNKPYLVKDLQTMVGSVLQNSKNIKKET